MASPLLSELTFGSLLSYSPRGTSEVSIRSRTARTMVKNASPAALRRAIEVLVDEFPRSSLDAVLGPDVILIPAPRSSLLVEGALWPALEIANALCAAGFGQIVRPILSRTEALPKSALQKSTERPTARRQYETLALAPELLPARVTVVDDVVTRGATLLAAASRVAETSLNVQVSAFALLRTISDGEIDRIVDPALGVIRLLQGGGTRREP